MEGEEVILGSKKEESVRIQCRKGLWEVVGNIGYINKGNM